VQKESNGSVEGKYVGEWGALPYKIGFDSETRLFNARMDMSMCSLGDTAEINLRKG